MTPCTVLDVSRWQGSIDWDTVVKSGQINAVMLRALGCKNGKPYIDPMFEQNYRACTRLGLPVGAYFYTCAQTEAAQDAELELLRTALTGKQFQMPVAVDVEDDRLRLLPVAKLTALVARAAAQIERWGLYAMVYTYLSFAASALDMKALAAYDVWLAAYRKSKPSPGYAFGMWQYTSSASVPGIHGSADLSHAYKDYPTIIRRAGLERLKTD